jgi:hypothetical protein
MTEAQQLLMEAQLMQWALEKPDMRLAIVGMVKSYKVNSLGELAAQDPEAFELLYDSIKDAIEQIPEYWTP